MVSAAGDEVLYTFSREGGKMKVESARVVAWLLTSRGAKAVTTTGEYILGFDASRYPVLPPNTIRGLLVPEHVLTDALQSTLGDRMYDCGKEGAKRLRAVSVELKENEKRRTEIVLDHVDESMEYEQIVSLANGAQVPLEELLKVWEERSGGVSG